ncbi:predicted protein [Sclerotinia sclerotiorum 1980 UF-70]|uniref:Uncharacterized protein n=1 Tax=Sclerotinia sclerotiorum (strain ATCC 18683 / 1980 / Ss-1) TaxID=665079 RepID=A7EDI4_SCLS1|nr:predicted protein [Sclerotinia sclerotiorum 1980 UF-70]EDO00900.1 predicted protein [Sclerotinia sclerotiorum 1980 UF-70]
MDMHSAEMMNLDAKGGGDKIRLGDRLYFLLRTGTEDSGGKLAETAPTYLPTDLGNYNYTSYK